MFKKELNICMTVLQELVVDVSFIVKAVLDNNINNSIVAFSRVKFYLMTFLSRSQINIVPLFFCFKTILNLKLFNII